MALRIRVAICNSIGEARSIRTIMVTRLQAAQTQTLVRLGWLRSMRYGFIPPISECRLGLLRTRSAECSIPATSLLQDCMRAATTCSRLWEAPTQDQASLLDRRSRLLTLPLRMQRYGSD